MSSGFNTAEVDQALEGTQFHGKLHHFSTIDSTNTRAIADAQTGIAAGQVYIADEQTAGRGRGGHTWDSQPDRGLYLTALVRPELRAEAALSISLAAGLAASFAIEEVCGYRIDLRWPNDLVTHEHSSRKLGGILTESASSPDGRLSYAAVGIGINLNQTEFPTDLVAEATSLRLATGHTVSREALAAALLQQLDSGLLKLCRGGEAATFSEFALRSSWVEGKLVRVGEVDGYTGVTAGLTRAGLLRVHCHDGTERVVRHGSVRTL